MKRLLVAVALALSVSPAYAANLATPTATAALATPIPTPILVEPGFRPIVKGECSLDLPSIAAPAVPTPQATPVSIASFGMVPTVVKASCGAPGVEVGDMVSATMRPYDTGTTNYEALDLGGCEVLAKNAITCWFKYSGGTALDPGPVTVRYWVVR